MKMTSCQAPLMDESCRAIATYLSERLDEQVLFIEDIDWEERYRQLDRGELDLAWICGGPYVRRVDRGEIALEPLVAPVWRGERYAGQPVYFSDLIVRGDRPFRRFADLQGASWVYNEPGSLSGYEAMRYHLARQGLDGTFFGRVAASGSHQQSVEWVLAGEAEVSAIDSTVLSSLLRRRPALGEQLRVVEAIGPSPMPPWVVTSRVPPATRRAIRQLMTTMNTSAEGQTILEEAGIARIVEVEDRTYKTTRAMLQIAETVVIRPG